MRSSSSTPTKQAGGKRSEYWYHGPILTKAMEKVLEGYHTVSPARQSCWMPFSDHDSTHTVNEMVGNETGRRLLQLRGNKRL